MNYPQICLASSSPRRRALLDQMGITYFTESPEVEERRLENESCINFVKRMALEKAQSGFELSDEQSIPVLGADTCIVTNDIILGKPANYEDFCATMELLSDGCHSVYSAVAIVDKKYMSTKKTLFEESANDDDLYRCYGNICISITEVTFRAISASERQAYWQSGEPNGKAGGYAIQGKGAAFISRIDGSYSGVMGLPLYETSELLNRFGIHVLSNEYCSGNE